MLVCFLNYGKEVFCARFCFGYNRGMRNKFEAPIVFTKNTPNSIFGLLFPQSSLPFAGTFNS